MFDQYLDANEIDDVKVNEQILRNERLKRVNFTSLKIMMLD